MNDMLAFSAGGILAWLASLVKPILIVVAGKFIITAVLRVTSNVMDRSNLDRGITGFIRKALRILLWVLVLIIAADALGVDTTSLVAMVSVVSLALSLAFQNIMTNIFSGVILLFSRPFAVGDFVTISGVSGTVKEITLMRTKLATPDNKIEWIPNGSIDAATITNFSAETLRRVELKVSVSHEAATQAVKDAVMAVIDRDTRILRDDESRAPFVRLSGYAPTGIEYTIRVWTGNDDYWGVYFDTLEGLRESFAAHGVKLSYPNTLVRMDR